VSILFTGPAGSILESPRQRDLGQDLSHHADVIERTFTEPQRQVYEAGTRFRLLCCGRRFGKTYLSVGQLLIWGMRHPGGLFWYVTSTYKAAKRIAWKTLREMAPPHLVAQVNHTELTVKLINGATISLMGADSPDSLRGSSLSGCVIDEAAYVNPRVWSEVVRPSLSDQQGPCWHITTPAGFNHFHDLWEGTMGDPTWARFSFTTLQGGQVPADEIEAAKRDMDARTFRQEYLASFESMAGRVYPDFSDDNISEAVCDTGGELLLGLDFNVGMMAGVLGSMAGDTLMVWDEIAMPNSNTGEVCQLVNHRFNGRRILAYPDPTGSARKTSSAGMTDHGILRQYGFVVVAPNAPWSVKDKLQATNYLIRNAEGQIRLRVHPRCKHLIRGLRGVTFKLGTDEWIVDKSPGLEHWCDALGYLILSAANRVKPWHAGETNIALY